MNSEMYTLSTNAAYSSLVVEVYPPMQVGKYTKSRFKFDARPEGAWDTVSKFANSAYLDGRKVTVYLLEKVGEGWKRTDLKSADGRPPKTSKTVNTAPATNLTEILVAVGKLADEIAAVKDEISAVKDEISAVKAELANKADKRKKVSK
jgi:uncharacterized small protein (DUF1192 family)